MSPSGTRADRVEDARQLHAAGYTSRAVWAKWALDDFKVLYGHLTDDGRPLEDDGGKLDSSFYLSADEWREVAHAAQGIANLAISIASARELGRDE